MVVGQAKSINPPIIGLIIIHRNISKLQLQLKEYAVYSIYLELHSILNYSLGSLDICIGYKVCFSFYLKPLSQTSLYLEPKFWSGDSISLYLQLFTVKTMKGSGWALEETLRYEIFHYRTKYKFSRAKAILAKVWLQCKAYTKTSHGPKCCIISEVERGLSIKAFMLFTLTKSLNLTFFLLPLSLFFVLICFRAQHIKNPPLYFDVHRQP